MGPMLDLNNLQLAGERQSQLVSLYLISCTIELLHAVDSNLVLNVAEMPMNT